VAEVPKIDLFWSKIALFPGIGNSGFFRNGQMAPRGGPPPGAGPPDSRFGIQKYHFFCKKTMARFRETHILLKNTFLRRFVQTKLTLITKSYNLYSFYKFYKNKT